ncbi:MAG TPA: VCBS repeat-containing protein, partial [bacterium]|nr:VCBS repeat-containing protein [bacterium]
MFTGDFDGDGLPDLFFSFPLKRDEDRAALYRNLGDFKFERVPVPFLENRLKKIEEYGLPTNGVFVDYDNDGDLDLLITYAFGSPVLLKNLLNETGRSDFEDVTDSL